MGPMTTPTDALGGPAVDDSLFAYDGAALKSVDGRGRIEGYLIVWGDEKSPDLQGDFMTPETDLGRLAAKSVGIDLYYVHGLPKIAGEKNPLEGQQIGEGEVKSDETGLWLQGQLALRTKYERRVNELAQLRKLGLSSGAATHLVQRQATKSGASLITRWPLVEASLTPIPVEPRTSVYAVKSLEDDLALKGAALGPDAEPAGAMGAVYRLADMVQYRCSEHMRDPKLSPADKMAACRACLDEFATTSARVIEAMLAGGDEAAAKSLIDSFGTGASSEPFLDTALRTASDLERAARRFPKLGTTKRHAIKTLRDSLGALLRGDGPDIEAGRHRVDELLSRLSK